MIRLCLTKGRLEESAIALFERAGIDCTPLKDKGRKLIIKLCDEIEIVFAKAGDVITYVEHGVCDMGVVGEDTIMEAERPVYEILDLKFGCCRFALATLQGYDFYSGISTKTVATKYPNVTKKYFDGKNMDIDIIKIEGSVELAPLLKLADAIVDIVETGKTLRENGLEVIEVISEISARLIVNPASFKLKKDEINSFISKITAVM